MTTDASRLSALESHSVQINPPDTGGFGHFVISMAGAYNEFPLWGQNPLVRDQKLRAFWPTEPWLAGTISSLAARNAAFSWTVEGPPRTSARIQEALHNSDFGRGWVPMLLKVSVDLYTTDNGAFMEVIRDGEGPDAPFIGLAHLDSGRCVRTGNWQFPVVYTDRDNIMHKMAWHRIIDLTDMPSPVETMNGMQLSAVSRILAMAKILRDIHVRKDEKLTGRYAGVLHVISGINQQMITDAFVKANAESDNRGRSRYQPPVIVGTLDPNAQVRKETIELASLPENYDQEQEMKWYIAAMALAFGCEYQDLAPLPGGGLGTSAQSETLHLKAKGRGPELFHKLIEHALNFRVLPQNVTFRFDEKDLAAMQLEATIAKLRAEARSADLTSGALTAQVVRQMMEDDGELRHEYLEMMNEQDITDESTMTDESHPESAGEMATNVGMPDQPDAGQETAQKQLDGSLRDGDYWAKPRMALEKTLEADMADVLAQVRRRVEARLRREVEAENA